MGNDKNNDNEDNKLMGMSLEDQGISISQQFYPAGTSIHPDLVDPPPTFHNRRLQVIYSYNNVTQSAAVDN